ncbi:MAG: hypothetical protein ACRYFV_09320, partial [Janthinobacterium lividum]
MKNWPDHYRSRSSAKRAIRRPHEVPRLLLSAPAHQLRYEAARQAKRQQETGSPLGARNPKARLLSNKTHYSP